MTIINGEAVPLQAGICSAVTHIVATNHPNKRAAWALGRKRGYMAGAQGACLWLRALWVGHHGGWM